MTAIYLQLATWIAMSVYLGVATSRWLYWKELCKDTDRDWQSAEERADHYFRQFNIIGGEIRSREATIASMTSRNKVRLERYAVLLRAMRNQGESIARDAGEMLEWLEKEARDQCTVGPAETTSK